MKASKKKQEAGAEPPEEASTCNTTIASEFLTRHGFAPIEGKKMIWKNDKKRGTSKQVPIRVVNWERDGRTYDAWQAQLLIYKSWGLKVDVNPRQLIKDAIKNSERKERERSGTEEPEDGVE